MSASAKKAEAKILIPLESDDIPQFFRKTRLQSLLIFGFAFLLYANTLGHQWSQDDAVVITENKFTNQGFSGIPDIFNKDTFFGFFKTEATANAVSGGRYRPLTVAMFAVLYQAFGKNPMPFHLLAVTLFALACLLLYRTLLLLLHHYRGGGYAALAAWMAAVLFAAHPIHTEAVANIKGCDEIVTLLGSLGALYFTVKAFDTGKMAYGLAAGGAMFLGLLAKENAVTFLAVIPLALWFFRGASGRSVVRFCWPLLAAFGVYWGIRMMVLPEIFSKPPIELLNNPFVKWVGDRWVDFTSGEKYSTIVYTLGKYVQLLVAPLTLTHDYYPRHVEIKQFANLAVLGSLALYIFLALYAILGVWNGKRDLLRFGILFYLITLSIVSNLVFPIGVNMGERFLFMPSVGFCLAVSAILLGFLQRGTGFDTQKIKHAMLLLGFLVLLYAAKTILRNPYWYDDKMLSFHDIQVSVNSAKLQGTCGGICCMEGQFEKDSSKQITLFRRAVPYLDKAIKIHPTYKSAWLNRGLANYHLKNYDAAIADFRRVTQIDLKEPKAVVSLGVALRDGGRFYCEEKNDFPKGLRLLNESYQIDSADTETIRLLGLAYGNNKQYAEAIRYFERRTQLQPDSPGAWSDLEWAYGVSGNLGKAAEYRAKAKQLEQNPQEK